MTGTVVLVTGANSGLGLATVQALAASPRGYRVLVGARTLDKAAEAVKQLSPSSGSEVRPIEVNISSDESIARAYDTVKEKYGRIDVLINNAGANFDILHRQGQMGLREAWAQSWDTNVTGGHVLTHTLAPLLLASQDPRLIFVSSTTASLQVASGPPPSWNAAMPAGWPKPAVGIAFSAYRSSKTGLNMMMLEWARMFKQDGVRVFGVDPGRLVTNLGRRKPDPELAQKMGLRDPSEGADLLLQIVEGKKDAEAGKVIDENGGVMPW